MIYALIRLGGLNDCNDWISLLALIELKPHGSATPVAAESGQDKRYSQLTYSMTTAPFRRRGVRPLLSESPSFVACIANE
jgi:hypothetical protein